MSLIERVQKFDCVTPDLSETAVHFHESEAAVGKTLSSTGPPDGGGAKNRPRGSREREPVHVKYAPNDNDEVVAHQQLSSNFAITFEARMA